MLRGGDRRSIGRVDEVIRRVRDPEGFRELVTGLLSPNELVRMRCADAIEKVSRIHAGWLEPHTAFFVEQAARQTQQEVRWHMAQIIPRLSLARSQRARAIRILRGYLDDSSGIVRVSALQALAELSVHDPRLGRQIVSLINQVMTNGTPAVRARGRRLVRELQSRKE
jgi:HEAT repeat protein